MIVKYTEEERQQLEDLIQDYNNRLLLLNEKLTSHRDPEEFEQIIKEYVHKHDEYESGSPEWKEARESDLVEAYRKWYAIGSPEWKKARDEYFSLHEEYNNKRNQLQNQIEKAHFEKLEGDPEKILVDARSQAEELICSRYEEYKELAKGNIPAERDRKMISGFSGHDLRVDGVKFWLDANEISKDIKRCLWLHYDFLKADPDLLKRLNDIVSEVISNSKYVSDKDGKLGAEFAFKKPRTKKDLPVYDSTEDQEFFMFSTTEPDSILHTLLSKNGNFISAAASINRISKSRKAVPRISKKTGVKHLKVENERTITDIEIMKEEFSGRTVQKVLFFITNELLSSAYYNGEMHEDTISYPLQKMVDKKLYTSLNNARKAFNDASDTLTTIRMSASIKAGNESFDMGDGGRFVLFPSMYIKKGQCYIRVNKDIGWKPILNTYFFLPESWYSLSDNAAELEYRIFRSARLNKDKINLSKGILSFNVSLRSISEWLNLPGKGSKNPKRDIKDPIEKAIKQMSDSLNPDAFKAEIKTDLNAMIEEYLSGYVEITISGEYLEGLKDLKAKRNRIIESRKAKNNSIQKEAAAMAANESMKKDNSKEEKTEKKHS